MHEAVQDDKGHGSLFGGVGMKGVVNFGESVRARLLAIAKQENVQLEYLLLRYALERFLYRLGKTEHVDRLVLKGASAFAVWLGPYARVTRDADVEAFGFESPEATVEIFKEICSLPYPEDAVEFDTESFTWEQIKKDGEYPGVRIKFNAAIGGARVALQFDVGVGDSVYPPAEMEEYPTLLGHAAPRLRIYPRYTVVSEKFSNMLIRGMLNSRLKDYYDIWMLSRTFDFSGKILAEAIARTFERRHVAMPASTPESLSPEFAKSPMKVRGWESFVKTVGHARKPESLMDAVAGVKQFLEPALAGKDMSGLIWRSCKCRWTNLKSSAPK